MAGDPRVDRLFRIEEEQRKQAAEVREAGRAAGRASASGRRGVRVPVDLQRKRRRERDWRKRTQPFVEDVRAWLGLQCEFGTAATEAYGGVGERLMRDEGGRPIWTPQPILFWKYWKWTGEFGAGLNVTRRGQREITPWKFAQVLDILGVAVRRYGGSPRWNVWVRES